MNEYTAPGEVTVDPSDNAISALWSRAAANPDDAALAYRDGDRYVDVSVAELAETVKDLAAGLVALGVEPGSRIALFASTRIEFTYAQYASWAAGCASVTIYETSSPEQVQWIMSDSGASVIFVENAELKATYDEVADRLPDVQHVVVIDDGGMDGLREHATDAHRQEVERRSAAISHDDLALLIYTSGTTGRPKGCILSHENFIWTVRQGGAAMPDILGPGQSTLMFLPLAHSFAQVLQVGCVTFGSVIGYSTGVANLTEELAMFAPTWVFSVPRVFEKVYNTAKQRADSEGKGKIFDLAVKTAIDQSRQEERGRVGLKTRLLHTVFDRLVYGKLRAVFGGRLVYAVSGGAALGERLGHFFRGIGLTVLEGYGLTETTAAAFYNRPHDFRIGSVGKPTPGVTVRIADDGEVLVKGQCVFGGYWNNEAATAETFDEDGWLRTGDIGELDERGFLSITGRKKELIVTAGGKNVAPAVLEDRLRAHPLISQCMVIGDAQPFIAALVTIDPETWPLWAEERGHEGKSLGELIDDPQLNAEIQAAIDDANRAVSKAESIRTFRILPEDFSIDGGELTPTLKVKRAVINKKYGAVIDQIYTG